MIKVNKLDEKSFSVQNGDGEVKGKASIYKADTLKNGAVLLTPKNARNDESFSGEFSNWQINGETPSSAIEAIQKLNAFVGNFNSGGSTPTPTTPINSRGELSFSTDGNDINTGMISNVVSNGIINDESTLVVPEDGFYLASLNIPQEIEGIGMCFAAIQTTEGYFWSPITNVEAISGVLSFSVALYLLKNQFISFKYYTSTPVQLTGKFVVLKQT